MNPGPGDPAVRGRIARAVGELHGRSPVETYLERDLVVCTHPRGVGLSERAPSERDLIAAVEASTGRPVVAFLDAREPDQPMAAELFFLDPSGAPSLSQFGLSLETLDGTAVLRVAGDLDRGTVPAVVREGREQIDRCAGRLVLDLSATGFMDVAAIHLMERLSRLARAAGGCLFVVLACPRARHLLSLVPPSVEVNVVSSVEEALISPLGSDLADTA